MADRHDLGLLITRPEEFLKNNLLCMRGTMPTVAGFTNFTFTDMTTSMGYSCRRRSRFVSFFDRAVRVWDLRAERRGRSSAAMRPSTCPMRRTSSGAPCCPMAWR
jgi:hypothetical protein